ncbi:MAG: hypothetical protein KatS3mg105_4787 [Gemmatales bacterium]|nr:MAG: hypothetical protein KatS3mg105_4787 [Gemmatales bacterium]
MFSARLTGICDLLLNTTMGENRLRTQMVVTLCILCFASSVPAADDFTREAQKFGKTRPVVSSQPDGLLICEGEEFQVRSPGWQAKPFGTNYYAATFANSFLSRQAFLGAPEQCEESAATIQVDVPKAGKYLVLVRYEAAFRFETQFRVRIEQQGQRVLDRLYGARDNVKIWAFRQKLKKEVGWSWGAVENIVWEGHDAFANLQKGPAEITLLAGKQPEPAARRNIDLVMLTTDVEQVRMRIEKENYLPLDGMLTQAGDVWLRVTNRGSKPLTFRGKKAMGGGNWQEHSPYWVHLRKWPQVKIDVQPGQTSAWTEVGSTMDSLSDGQWFWTGNGPYRAEFGLKGPNGKIESIARFDGEGDLVLAADGDTRYSRRLRRLDQVLYDLLDEIKKANPAPHGKTPSLTTIYATTFTPLDNGKHASAVAEFKKLFALTDPVADAPNGRGYIDVRGVPTPKLADYCQKLNGKNIAVVSLGDEISLPKPGGAKVHEGFRDWLKTQGVKPADVDPAAGGDFSKIHYDLNPSLQKTKPGVYYWSRRYLYDFGIRAIKQRTDILRKHLPNAGIGANYSPHYPTEHMFLGETYKWISTFRRDGMTMPWSEDYIWQVAVGTAQMNNINLDQFRAALKGKPIRKIHYYVMPHAPNNTPATWRRLFFSALGHGMKIINLFEFRPVHVAYTENHVDHPEMYVMILKSFREYGLFEDIVQTGRVRPAEAALWFSETGDIWGDSHGSFAAAKRSLYTAIRHQQIPLDFVVEPDCYDGTLDRYKVLYLTDAHVSRRASEAIARWVQKGGVVFATAGAGMFDERNRPNDVLRKLFGIDQTTLEAPPEAQITWIKQDLPFAKPIDKVVWGHHPPSAVIAVRSRIKTTSAKVSATFADGNPAVVTNTPGKGKTVYCAFLPGLSYYKPAVPKRPVDRGATDDAMVHFLPTAFDSAVGQLIGSAAVRLVPPVRCTQPLVETTVIESKVGVVIPLVNWTPNPVKGLRVEINVPAPQKATLASGKPLKVESTEEKRVYTFDLDIADALILR